MGRGATLKLLLTFTSFSHRIVSHRIIHSYINIRKKFPDNVVDIATNLNRANLKIEDLILDRGGHPSMEGLRFMVDILVFGGKPPPAPSLLEVIFNRRNVVRAGLMFSHRIVEAGLVPLQRYLAVVRPRRKYRGSNLWLLLATRLTNLYQLHLYAITNLTIVNETGLAGWMRMNKYYKISYTMIFGWEGYDGLSPPLLT